MCKTIANNQKIQPLSLDYKFFQAIRLPVVLAGKMKVDRSVTGDQMYQSFSS